VVRMADGGGGKSVAPRNPFTGGSTGDALGHGGGGKEDAHMELPTSWWGFILLNLGVRSWKGHGDERLTTVMKPL